MKRQPVPLALDDARLAWMQQKACSMLEVPDQQFTALLRDPQAAEHLAAFLNGKRFEEVSPGVPIPRLSEISAWTILPNMLVKFQSENVIAALATAGPAQAQALLIYNPTRPAINTAQPNRAQIMRRTGNPRCPQWSLQQCSESQATAPHTQ